MGNFGLDTFTEFSKLNGKSQLRNVTLTGIVVTSLSELVVATLTITNWRK